MKILAASVALAGLDGCFYKKPQGTIVPAPRAPEQTVLGRPTYFASAMPFDGYGRGVLVQSHEGRPTKIEGNPDHPASLGAADIFMQAAVLELYDPDRARTVTLAGRPSDWGAFCLALRQRLDATKGDGRGVHLLTGTMTSPTFATQLDAFRRQFPNAIWHQYDPIRHPGGEPSSLFPHPVNTVHDLSAASVIASFGMDFLFGEPGSIRYARQFSDGRRVRQDRLRMNRLYVAESTMTLTGSVADHRLAMRPARIGALIRALAQRLGVAGEDTAPRLPEDQMRWIDALADDLRHPPDGGATLVLAGKSQPLADHALVHRINQTLGNLGKTVYFTEPLEPPGGQPLAQLVQAMQAGEVQVLLMCGVNPAYNAPADIAFAQALERTSQALTSDGRYRNFTASLSTHYDETAFLCQWHVPQAHWLESWGDVRAFDGTSSIIQPLIAPLYDGKTLWELMEVGLGNLNTSGFQIIREYWQAHHGSDDFEQWWVQTLQRGTVAGSELPHQPAPELRPQQAPMPAPEEGIEILFQPDWTVWNGQFANNGWLQELPRPFTKLTWDNCAVISLAIARKLGRDGKMLRDGDIVRINYRRRMLDVPVMITLGQADDVITLHLGYGRSRGGSLLLEEEARPRGYNAYVIRTSDAPWHGTGAQLARTDRHHLLVVTRSHHAMAVDAAMPGIQPALKPEVVANPADPKAELVLENRKLIRTATLDYYREHPDFVKELAPDEKKPLLSLYPGWPHDQGLQWGMVIDQTVCIGCNACVIACQAENNIPIVGREEVSRQREMHWIRIDDYFTGPPDNPQVFHQPVPCMHCENAPCEYVCPVGATTHSDEGLNEMTYNRCIGTRYCSNNCPYKVRRFNFLLYSDYDATSRSFAYNPDVTVRSRGVMEKCTYCVQRLNRTRIEMETSRLQLEEQAANAPTEEQRQRLLQEVKETQLQILRTLQTACQQSCPTQAIVFGDLRDPGGPVAQLKTEPTEYGLLTDLTTKPRTTYLAHLSNPNTKLGGRSA